VAGLAVTSQGHIVAVDSVSPTVFVISEGGDLLRWFDCSDYMREPSDIAISGKVLSVKLVNFLIFSTVCFRNCDSCQCYQMQVSMRTDVQRSTSFAGCFFFPGTTTPLGVVSYSPLAGFSLLAYEVS